MSLNLRNSVYHGVVCRPAHSKLMVILPACPKHRRRLLTISRDEATEEGIGEAGRSTCAISH
jgi:hypothetical protein